MKTTELKDFAIEAFRTSLFSDNDVLIRKLSQLNADEVFFIKEFAARFYRVSLSVLEEKK